ncbi:MAG: hypothetical protein A2632_00095 [Candidatus Pacebacteria bacterium RIFCSPHIGHO2_01_FULL_46_16]|nr:MAG: hypothetical protein A2632_00095 [Candidatus Pacebacteria bacterium RIFCSPHIGHO2_01_FULL_46_16]OGJ39208.1 MAG: hypothetical protein A3A82_00175 [Candidatus Pacebacteria bacterium RIFCSPLOWO2_01_FULL_47_12]
MTAQPVVVLVTGVFDCLHQEHIEFLRKAKAAGDMLVVGVECDERVRQLKGEHRPLHSQSLRVKNLRAVHLAHKVFILPSQFSHPDEHRAVLQKIHPDILAVSSHTPHRAQKARLMQEIGGRVVVVHQHNPVVSTTLLLENKPKASHAAG